MQGSTSVPWERELMDFRLLFHTPEIIRNINITGRDVLTWVIFTFVVNLWRNGKILTKRLREGLWVSRFTILQLRVYSQSLYCFWWMKKHFLFVVEVPATAWRNWWHDVILVDSDGKVVFQSLYSALCYVQILESVKRASEIALQCEQCRSMIWPADIEGNVWRVAVERFHARDQQQCKFVTTKEHFFIRKESTPTIWLPII